MTTPKLSQKLFRVLICHHFRCTLFLLIGRTVPRSGCVLGRKARVEWGLTFSLLCKSAGPPQASFQVPALAGPTASKVLQNWLGLEFLGATTSPGHPHPHPLPHPAPLLVGLGERSGSPSSTTQLWWLLSSERAQTQQTSGTATDRRRRATGFRFLCPRSLACSHHSSSQTPITDPVCSSRCISLNPAAASRCISLHSLHVLHPRETSNLPDSASVPTHHDCLRSSFGLDSPAPFLFLISCRLHRRPPPATATNRLGASSPS